MEKIDKNKKDLNRKREDSSRRQNRDKMRVPKRAPYKRTPNNYRDYPYDFDDDEY